MNTKESQTIDLVNSLLRSAPAEIFIKELNESHVYKMGAINEDFEIEPNEFTSKIFIHQQLVEFFRKLDKLNDSYKLPGTSNN